jgi:hypothetical protein
MFPWVICSIAARNAETMQLAWTERLENQQIERPLQQIGWLYAHAHSPIE